MDVKYEGVEGERQMKGGRKDKLRRDKKEERRKRKKKIKEGKTRWSEQGIGVEEKR